MLEQSPIPLCYHSLPLIEPQPVPPFIDPERWLTDHGDMLWRYAIARVRDTHVAEELIQAALVAALESHAGFRGESTERTWLMSILRHKIADHGRARQRERTLREPASVNTANLARDDRYNESGGWLNSPAAWSRSLTRTLENDDFWREFEACLGLLPAGVAEAFILREVRGIDAPVACAELRITPENLWVRMHRAREMLRKCLSGKLAGVQKGTMVRSAGAHKGGSQSASLREASVSDRGSAVRTSNVGGTR